MEGAEGASAAQSNGGGGRAVADGHFCPAKREREVVEGYHITRGHIMLPRHFLLLSSLSALGGNGGRDIFHLSHATRQHPLGLGSSFLGSAFFGVGVTGLSSRGFMGSGDLARGAGCVAVGATTAAATAAFGAGTRLGVAATSRTKDHLL